MIHRDIEILYYSPTHRRLGLAPYPLKPPPPPKVQKVTCVIIVCKII